MVDLVVLVAVVIFLLLHDDIFPGSPLRFPGRPQLLQPLRIAGHADRR